MKNIAKPYHTATQCRDTASGQTGSFYYDKQVKEKTGNLVAVGPVYPSHYEQFRARVEDGAEPGTYGAGTFLTDAQVQQMHEKFKGTESQLVIS